MVAVPAAEQIRNALRQYTKSRLDFFAGALDPLESSRASSLMAAALKDLWSGVKSAVDADSQLARTSQIVPAANAVIDMDATRSWASHNQTPPSVIVLLAICAIVSSGLMGHSSGQAGRRHLGHWIALNVLIMLVLFVVLDFDRPRRGLIRVNHAPLVEVLESMNSE